jgi:hypothetical protein
MDKAKVGVKKYSKGYTDSSIVILKANIPKLSFSFLWEDVRHFFGQVLI